MTQLTLGMEPTAGVRFVLVPEDGYLVARDTTRPGTPAICSFADNPTGRRLADDWIAGANQQPRPSP